MLEWLNIVFVVFGIALMLLLNMRFKMNAMLALLLGALLIGLLELLGMNLGWLPQPEEALSLGSLLKTIQTGFGSTLGSLAIIVVFGAVIGKLMVDSGAANQIAETLIEKLGVRNVKIAMVLAGTVFGLAMFYEVAFIIMAPLIVAVAHEAKMPSSSAPSSVPGSWRVIRGSSPSSGPTWPTPTASSTPSSSVTTSGRTKVARP